MLVFHVDDDRDILDRASGIFENLRTEISERQRSQQGTLSPSKNETSRKKLAAIWATVVCRRTRDWESLEFLSAPNEEEFWNVIHRRQEDNLSLPTVIFLDLKLDGTEETGLSLLNQIKENDLLKNIPVVMLSQFNDPEYVSECIRRGAVAYVTKDGIRFMDRFLELVVHWLVLVEARSLN